MIITELRYSTALGNRPMGGEFRLSFFDKYDIKCLMPRNMCWDPVSNAAEVWCCSEHYLWLFDGGLYLDPFTAMQCCRAVISEDAKSTLASGLQNGSLKHFFLDKSTDSKLQHYWSQFKR